MTNVKSAAEAVSIIESGNRVFIHSAAATPQTLVKAMTARASELKNVEIVFRFLYFFFALFFVFRL